jgi:hypothetical protein
MPNHQDLLIELWKQSCANVHAAQDRLRNTLHVFLVASFGISAFLLSDGNLLTSLAPYFAVTADVLLLVVFKFLIDLAAEEIKMSRATVESYEHHIKQALDDPHFSLKTALFPKLDGVEPLMPLRNELRTAWVSFSVVAVKAALLLATFLFLSSHC